MLSSQDIEKVKKYLEERLDGNEFSQVLLTQLNSEIIEVMDPKTKQKKRVTNSDSYRIYLIQKSINPVILRGILYGKKEKK